MLKREWSTSRAITCDEGKDHLSVFFPLLFGLHRMHFSVLVILFSIFHSILSFFYFLRSIFSYLFYLFYLIFQFSIFYYFLFSILCFSFSIFSQFRNFDLSYFPLFYFTVFFALIFTCLLDRIFELKEPPSIRLFKIFSLCCLL